MPTNFLYSGALHWIAKYLRDFIFLWIHSVYVIYTCVYVCIYTHIHTCIYTHTHTIYIELYPTVCVGDDKGQKRRACLPIKGGKEKWVCEQEKNKEMVKWGGCLRPAFLEKDFERDGRSFRRGERRRGGDRAEGKLRNIYFIKWDWGNSFLKRQVQWWLLLLPADQNCPEA